MALKRRDENGDVMTGAAGRGLSSTREGTKRGKGKVNYIPSQPVNSTYEVKKPSSRPSSGLARLHHCRPVLGLMLV
ncbi:hypothetical protein CBS147347_11007 [Aspergillus niger]|nr:hypothetical protein CBS147371_6371 [Aspergillus niger]KAI2939627.1 hypothetical protein CBS147322_10098 [Aspergillus niger]KAI2998514.1 hypothetical protein CBS147346_8175 [Aspergillus niger]KAI3015935.1 hypothetical protein CBS147347_11007 [Aspergillus niger]